MSKSLAGVLRTLFALLGLVLIALGLWPVLIQLKVGGAEYLAAWIDHDYWATVPAQAWWPWALGAGAAACAALGLWLIIAPLRVRKINHMESAASNNDGKITLLLTPMMKGISAALRQHPQIVGAEHQLAFDRGRPQLTLTVTASPEFSWTDNVGLLEQLDRDLDAAFPDIEVDRVYKLYYQPLKPQERN